jgi:hypothetical protein
VPWLWSHPRWFETRTWTDQLRAAWDSIRSALARWWSGPDRLAVAWQTIVLGTKRSLGLA